MILYPNLSTLCGNAISCTLYLAQSLPSLGLDRHSIAFTDQMILLERNYGARRALIEIVLDQLGDQIVAIEVKEVVPKARYPIGLGDELAVRTVIWIVRS